jgi:hypothetical protein
MVHSRETTLDISATSYAQEEERGVRLRITSFGPPLRIPASRWNLATS